MYSRLTRMVDEVKELIRMETSVSRLMLNTIPLLAPLTSNPLLSGRLREGDGASYVTSVSTKQRGAFLSSRSSVKFRTPPTEDPFDITPGTWIVIAGRVWFNTEEATESYLLRELSEQEQKMIAAWMLMK